MQAAAHNASTGTWADGSDGSTNLPLCQLVRGQDDVLLNKRLYQAPALPAIISQHVCDGPVGLYQRRGVGLEPLTQDCRGSCRQKGGSLSKQWLLQITSVAEQFCSW